MANATAVTPALSPARFIVQDLFPAEEVHIIFGPTRAGKTSLALQAFDDFCHARPVLGYKSYPAPACFISCGRNRASLRAHMQRLHLDPNNLPHLGLPEILRADEYNLAAAYQCAKQLLPAVRVLFLDGMDTLASGNRNDSRDASHSLISATRFCYENQLTVIGTAPAVKAKEGSGYLDPLDRISGSGSIMSHTATKILIERWKTKDITEPTRRVTLCPSQMPEIIKFARFSESGTLTTWIDAPEDAQSATNPRHRLDAWLTEQSDELLPLEALRAFLSELNLSESTLFRWLDDQCELGVLERKARGKYFIARNRPAIIQ